METRRKEEQTKQVKKRFQDFQKSHINCEKERKDLTDKLIKVEKEKIKINDKYIKLSQRLKEGGTSSRDENQAKIKEYQLISQKQSEEINQLTDKLNDYLQKEKIQPIKYDTQLGQESDQTQRIFERFSSELVCACLHELMLEISQKMPIQGDATFDIAKFQQFLREQNCKECGHADLIDLELGSIIVLTCKRIKDLIYLVDEQSEKLQMTNTQLRNATQQLLEKSQQLENMQQNLMSMLQLNLPNGQIPIQGAFFNGQNTKTSSQIFKHMNFQTTSN